MTDKQTDTQTDTTENNTIPPSLRSGKYGIWKLYVRVYNIHYIRRPISLPFIFETNAYRLTE